MGRLVASFRFNALGMSLTESVESVTDQHRITLSVVDSKGSKMRLAVTLDDPSELIALERAQTIADAVYERILLDLGIFVANSARPVRENYTFTDPTGVSTSIGRLAGTANVSAGGLAALDAKLVKPALDRALFDLEVSQPASADEANSARAMYRVAMQTSDPVASYLICYSALLLIALFKRGPNAKQRDVDDLLTAEDASVQRSWVPLDDGKSKYETPFTTARNRFVHAEERGKDPEGAAREMSDRLRPFRELTARILRRL